MECASGGGGGGATEKIMLVDLGFMKSLKRDPERRSEADAQTIYYTLRYVVTADLFIYLFDVWFVNVSFTPDRSLQCLSRLPPEAIYQIAQTGYYMKKQANDILYCRGEIAHCWFILISGSVFIDGSMFLPITRFAYHFCVLVMFKYIFTPINFQTTVSVVVPHHP